MKNTAIITLSTLLLLAVSSFAQANPRGSYTNDYTVYESRRTVTHYGNYCPDRSYSHAYDRQRIRPHQRPNIYVEQNIYNYQAPRATHRRTYRNDYRQQTHNPRARGYSNYSNTHRRTYRGDYRQQTRFPRAGYSNYSNTHRGNVVGDTVIGGAFGAAAGAAIGAAVGNPGQCAALGAAIGGFTGLGHGIFGRGSLW